MAKLPLYTQQYKVSGPRATADSFGGQEAKALTQLGEATSQLARVVQYNADRKDKLKAELIGEKIKREYISTREQRRNEAGELDKFADESLLYYNDLADLYKDELGPAGKEHLRSITEKFGTSIYESESVYSANRLAEIQVQDATELMDYSANSILQDPSTYNEYINNIDETVNLLPGSENEANRSKYGSMIREKYTTAYNDSTLLNSKTSDDVTAFIDNFKSDPRNRENLSPSAYSAFLSRAETKKQTLLNSEAGKIKLGLDDEIARLQAGTGVRTYTNDQIMAAHPNDPETAKRKIALVDLAQETGIIKDQIKGMSPAEISEMIDKQEADIKDPTKMSALEQNQYQALAMAVDAHKKALQKDPAAYLLEINESVSDAYDRYTELQAQDVSPELRSAAFDEYVAQTTSAQEHLGVSSAATRITTDAMVQSYANDLAMVQRDGEELTNRLTTLATLHGDHWPRILAEMGDKVPNDVIALSEMWHAPEAATQLAGVADMSVKELVGDQKTANDLRENVNSKAVDFRQVYMLSPTGAATYGKRIDSATKLAAIYTNQGVKESLAIERALEDVFGSRKYAPTFTVRSDIPDAQSLVDFGNARLRTAHTPEFGFPEFDVPAKMTRNDMLKVISHRAVFVDDPTSDDHLLVMYEKNYGYGDYVHVTKNGQPIRFSLGDVRNRINAMNYDTTHEYSGVDE